MLAPPSLLDRLIGNLPVYLLIVGSFVTMFVLWLDEKAPNQYLPFVLGFISIVATNSRKRLRAEAHWQTETAAITGQRNPGRSRWRYVLLAPLWAVVLFVGYHIGRGAIGEQEVSRWQREAFASGVETQAVALSYAKQVIARQDVQLAAGGALALVVLWQLRRRRARSGSKRRFTGGWDGTVRVMLPVPKDDR